MTRAPLHTVFRVALIVATALCLGTAAAQSGWTVLAPEDDVVSFAGLGSMVTRAFDHPEDMRLDDTALVIACDPESPIGFEASVWVDTDGSAANRAHGSVLLRVDQGAILERSWLRVDPDGFTEAIAPYEDTEELFALLRGAHVLAFRLAGVAGVSADRTFQFDVRGFEAAFGALRCASLAGATAPMTSEPAPVAVDGGAWGVIPGEYASAGARVGALEEVLVVFCSGDANGIGIDVGAYDTPGLGANVEAVFRSGSVDFLTARLRPNAFGSYEVVDDVDENRLVRNLRLMTDVTVTLRQVGGGASRSFTLPTAGFAGALDALGCFVAAR